MVLTDSVVTGWSLRTNKKHPELFKLPPKPKELSLLTWVSAHTETEPTRKIHTLYDLGLFVLLRSAGHGYQQQLEHLQETRPVVYPKCDPKCVRRQTKRWTPPKTALILTDSTPPHLFTACSKETHWFSVIDWDSVINTGCLDTYPQTLPLSSTASITAERHRWFLMLFF